MYTICDTHLTTEDTCKQVSNLWGTLSCHPSIVMVFVILAFAHAGGIWWTAGLSINVPNTRQNMNSSDLLLEF